MVTDYIDEHGFFWVAIEEWMLQEIGKRDEDVLKGFLRENYSELPRTTLRYAIERLEEDLRKRFLLGDHEGH